MRIITTYATVKTISAREEIKDPKGNVIGISNEGQSCAALIPGWSNWGKTLEDGTELDPSKTYKITIEVE